MVDTTLSFQNHIFDFSQKTYIMGILNVTPDSFSDGGLFIDRKRAVEHAISMVESGADIIDIGGESTRPGSSPVTLNEELKRTIPVIETLSDHIKVPISIDTYKAEVAKMALSAGASIVNDISGLRFDPEMAYFIARKRVPVVIMHIQGTPKNMQKNPFYDDLIREVIIFLRDSIEIAKIAGIKEDMVIIDPGIGFGKTMDHNLQLIKHLGRFKELKRPLLIGTSRKTFIGHILGNISTDERLMGTAATVAISIMNGANIVRVHDVKEIWDVVKLADAIKRA